MFIVLTSGYRVGDRLKFFQVLDNFMDFRRKYYEG
jgi:hypothetical protein